MEASPSFAQSVFDRTPPFSLEAETAVLGGMLMDRNATPEVLEVLTEASFYREANRRLFRGMTHLFEVGETIDVVTLSDRLKQTGDFEAAGGFGYLSGLLDAVPSAANIAWHARIVADKALQRRLVEEASGIIRDVYDLGDRTTSDVIAEAEQRILSLDARSNRAATRLLKEHLWPAFEQIEKWQELKGKTAGLSTGFESLDRQTTGMHAGEFWVVAGRPSMGKTSLVLDLLKNVSFRSSDCVWVKSLEMEGEELTIRMIAGEARLDLLKLRRGDDLTKDEHHRLAAAAGHLNTANILIDDNPLATISEVRSTARRVHQSHPLSLIVIDYLQLMEGDGKNRVEDVSKISRGLKLMARELRVPVIGVSQLSRGVEMRTNKRPVLSDLRDSGAIEQDADVVLMVYRPEYYMTAAQIKKAAGDPKTDARGLAEIVIPKQRNGPTGTVALFFDKPTTRFSEWKDRVPW